MESQISLDNSSDGDGMPFSNMSTPSSKPSFLPPVALAILSLQALFAFLIISSNTVAVVVFTQANNFLQSTGKYLLILAVVDLCTGFTVIFQCFFFFYPSMSTTKWTCMLRFQSVACLTLLSLVTLLQVCFERFLLITDVDILVYLRSGKKWIVLMTCLWLYVFAIFLYPFLGANNWDGKTPCKFSLIMRGEQMLWMCLTIWVVSAAMVVMYFKIWWVVRKKLFRVEPLPGENSAEGPSTSTSSEMLMFRHNLRATKVVFMMTALFTVCWVPYSFVQFLHFLYPWDPIKTMVGDLLVFIGVSNSFMNPFIYLWLKQDFRKAFLKLIRCNSFRLN